MYIHFRIFISLSSPYTFEIYHLPITGRVQKQPAPSEVTELVVPAPSEEMFTNSAAAKVLRGEQNASVTLSCQRCIESMGHGLPHAPKPSG